MDIYRYKFTILQSEIIRFLFLRPEIGFNGRALSKALKVSPTAIAKSLGKLGKESLINVTKDKEAKRLSISLNRDNPFVFQLKRADNLRLFYESGILGCLAENFPSATIILFGSYSFGEDTTASDIDLAIIGAKEKSLDLSRFSKILEREIFLHFFGNFSAIDKNLKENIFNGIILKGGIKL